MNRTRQVAIFGAAPDTSNLGVSALFASTIVAFQKKLPDAAFLVFDNGLGIRPETISTGNGESVDLLRGGAHAGRRLDRSENLMNMFAAAHLGTLGSAANRYIREIDRCEVVLDVSGGDSFSDIYGKKRFMSIARPKLISLRRKIPLVLLPQTYGPFKDEKLRNLAQRIVRRARMSWARDENSYEVLKELAGKQFDPERHRCGVDMAFGLRSLPPRISLPQKLADLLDEESRRSPLIGLNVSGLIFNDPELAASRYGFMADYRKSKLSFVNTVLRETDATVVLIPHVMAQHGHYESDPKACETIYNQVPQEMKHRIIQAPSSLNQSEVKWVISKMDWFCGTRMHSTIASLSSGVPTATVSYSDKALGVFKTCGQQDYVIDPRQHPTEAVVERLVECYRSRVTAKESLEAYLPKVLQTHDQQVAEIAAAVSGNRIITDSCKGLHVK